MGFGRRGSYRCNLNSIAFARPTLDGSPQFASNEITNDQYSLGCILYFGDLDRSDVMSEFAIVGMFLLAAFALSRLV